VPDVLPETLLGLELERPSKLFHDLDHAASPKPAW
jgi:hypothetical protein